MPHIRDLINKYQTASRRKITVSGHGVWMPSYSHLPGPPPTQFTVPATAKYKIFFYVAHGDGLGNATGMKLDGHDYDAVTPVAVASANSQVYNYMLTPKSLKADVTFIDDGSTGTADGAYLALGSNTKFDKDLVLVVNQFRLLKDIVDDVIADTGNDNVDIHWAACRQVLEQMSFENVATVQPKPFNRGSVTGKPTPSWLSGS